MPRRECAASRHVAEVGHRRTALIEAGAFPAHKKNRTACAVRPESRWRREGDLCRAYFRRYLEVSARLLGRRGGFIGRLQTVAGQVAELLGGLLRDAQDFLAGRVGGFGAV